jgi:hypothetical protein
MAIHARSRSSKISQVLAGTIAFAAIAFGVTPVAHAQTETTIYNFGAKGAPNSPDSGIVLGKSGTLYGVTAFGGTGHGVVYSLKLVAGGWQETALYTFTGGSDGGTPYTAPLLDANGNIYGTAQSGGTSGVGLVYELSPNSGGTWQETVLYSFTGLADGGYPSGNLVFDQAGNLYGSNSGDGNQRTEACQNTGGCGVIFKLSPESGGKWGFHLLHTFSGGRDGVGSAWLTFDPAGNLFGAAAGAWEGFELPSAPGLVFRLTPTASGPWKDSVVYAFRGAADGGLPSAVIFGPDGSMYGTGADGGLVNNCQSGYGPMGCGVVFKISPTADGGWKETAIYAFTGGSDGNDPVGALVFDNGKLYGATLLGGSFGYGVIFELAPSSGGEEWNESVAYTFDTQGSLPTGTLAVDAKGNLFGTARDGGANLGGVAFELAP